jgi:hypothetical protein
MMRHILVAISCPNISPCVPACVQININVPHPLVSAFRCALMRSCRLHIASSHHDQPMSSDPGIPSLEFPLQNSRGPFIPSYSAPSPSVLLSPSPRFRVWHGCGCAYRNVLRAVSLSRHHQSHRRCVVVIDSSCCWGCTVVVADSDVLSPLCRGHRCRRLAVCHRRRCVVLVVVSP